VRADAALADRNAAVRQAARSWRKKGAIDEATLAAIEKAAPDDRVRVGPVFRVLLFLFTMLAANALFGFLWLLFFDASGSKETGIGVAAIVFGLALVGLTEFQVARLKRSQGGTEAATSLVALGYLIGGFAWFAFEVLSWPDEAAIIGVLVAATVLLVAAAWRWGYPLYAGASAAALLLAIARYPGGRLLWIVLPLLAMAVLLRLADSERLPPAYRHSCNAVLIVSLIGLYVAVHLGSFEIGLVEEIGEITRSPGPASTSGVLWWLSAFATGLVPAVLLMMAIRTRRYPFLLVGLGTAVASLVTLRFYVHLAPLWVVLTVSGIALVAVVFAVRRYLDSGPNKERAGFTAEPLFEDLARQRLLEMGAAVVSLSPEARTIREEPRFEGGGGDLGGGGSTTEF
jgi:MFS family permease